VVSGLAVIALFGLIIAGVNVMVALGVVGAIGLSLIVGVGAATTTLANIFYDTTHIFHFSVIPLARWTEGWPSNCVDHGGCRVWSGVGVQRRYGDRVH